MTRKIWFSIVLLAVLNLPYSIAVYNHCGEDSYITFRYVENFVSGQGLVYNPGERVEGYSNFLWLMILALFRWLGFNIINVSKFLAVGANSLTIILSTIFLVSLLKSRFTIEELKKLPFLIFLFPALLIFFNPMLHYNSDRGLETCFYAMLLLTGTWLLSEERLLPASLVFSALALTRPEGFFYMGIATLFFFWLKLSVIKNQQIKIKNVRVNNERVISRARLKNSVLTDGIIPVLKFILPFTVIFGAYLIWRRSYYGYWLPNTVYAKVSKWNFYYNPSLGLLWQFVKSWSFLPGISVAGTIFLIVKEHDFFWRWRLLLVLGMAGGVLLYTLAIGYVLTDSFRHYVPAVPPLIVLLSVSIGYLSLSVRSPLALRLRLSLVVLLLGLNFYTSDNLDMPRSRLHCRTLEFLTRRDFGERWRWYLAPSVWLGAEAGRWLNQNIPPTALLAADQMGQLGYYSRHRIIDLLGLMDTEIAHRGYSTTLLLRRNPDYMVLLGMNNEPIIQQFKETIRDTEFRKKYKLRYILRANNELDRTEYLVYARRDLLAPNELDAEPRIFYLGLNKEEFLKRWRV